MADLISGARAILDECDPEAVAPGFTERLEVAARGGADGVRSRTIAAPYYLTDLGVRRFEDPSLFYKAHAERFEWRTMIDVPNTHDLLLCAPIEQLSGLLDACVLVLGDYDVAVDVVRSRLGGIEASKLFELQVYSGVILATFGDEGCREMLRLAASQSHVGAIHRFMANHRLAAAEIKRFKSPERGIEIVDEIDELMVLAAASGEISEGDRSAMESVTANLRALALLGLKDLTRARSEVERARQIATMEGLSKVKPDESARYAAQESINIAQLLVAGADNTQAIPVLLSNVEFCRENCPEYLGEAVSALAYGQFLAEDYVGSIDSARTAIEFVAREASPVRLRASREILVAALACAGRSEEAQQEFKLIDADPLGLTVSRSLMRGPMRGRL